MCRHIDQFNLVEAADKEGVFYHTHPEIEKVYRDRRTGLCTSQLVLPTGTEVRALTRLRKIIDPVSGRHSSVDDLNYNGG